MIGQETALLIALVAFPLAQIYCFGNADYRRHADAIVVFGACVHPDGSLAPVLYDRVLRIDQMPVVETYIVAEGDPMGGIGEPGTPPIAPALCNALLVLTGKPVRRLPIVKKA